MLNKITRYVKKQYRSLHRTTVKWFNRDAISLKNQNESQYIKIQPINSQSFKVNSSLLGEWEDPTLIEPSEHSFPTLFSFSDENYEKENIILRDLSFLNDFNEESITKEVPGISTRSPIAFGLTTKNNNGLHLPR